MNAAKLNSIFKSIMVCSIMAVTFLGLFGCGKSQAELQRDAGRQKFKEKIAALKVCTQGSTYSEFRQAEMDLKTSYEVNKGFLSDVCDQFDSLQKFMSATDFCWNKSIEYPMNPLPLGSRNDDVDVNVARIILPSISEKLNYDWKQRDNDKDFNPKNYVRLGLTKTRELCDLIISVLDKSIK